MFAKIGNWLKQSLLPMLAKSSNTVRTWWTAQGPLLLRETLLYGLMLLALVLLLAGCATPSSPPAEWPKNPQPPQLKEPLPSESYSKRVDANIKSWAERLMGTLLTLKP